VGDPGRGVAEEDAHRRALAGRDHDRHGSGEAESARAGDDQHGDSVDERGVELVEAKDFQGITGKGVRGAVDGRTVALGNRALMGDLGVELGPWAEKAEALRADGQTVMFVAVDGTIAGLLGVADPVKESTPEAIRVLHREGIRIVMLTGDSRTTAQAVARRLGIDDVIAEVLPRIATPPSQQVQA